MAESFGQAFSVTLYSSRFPSARRTWASSAGSAEEKKVMTAMPNHCTYWNGKCHQRKLAGRFGRMMVSTVRFGNRGPGQGVNSKCEWRGNNEGRQVTPREQGRNG